MSEPLLAQLPLLTVPPAKPRRDGDLHQVPDRECRQYGSNDVPHLRSLAERKSGEHSIGDKGRCPISDRRREPQPGDLPYG